MTDTKRADRLRKTQLGVRAAVGAVITAVALAALWLASTTDLTTLTATPPSTVVDTTHNTVRTITCSGSFSELGADPEDPEAAVPVGEPKVVQVGGDAQPPLTRPSGDAGLPAVLSGESGAPFAAAQTQVISTESLRGTVGGACVEPLNEQWLIGGETTVGVSTTLSIGNPGDVAATVRIAIFDENGEAPLLQASGVLVPAGTQQVISLNGYAPDRERLAVRLESTGAAVTASLGVGRTVGLDPFGVSSVDRQDTPSTHLVIPGITNTRQTDDKPTDVEGDPFPVHVRAVAPDGAAGAAEVFALDAKGHATALGELSLDADAVAELVVPAWPKGANAIELRSDVPIVASALGSAVADDERDDEWFSASPVVPAGQPVALPIAKGGQVVVAHPGEGEATVTVTDAKGKEREQALSPGSASVVKATSGSVLESSADVYVGVRVLDGSTLAGYAVAPPQPKQSELTVYTR